MEEEELGRSISLVWPFMLVVLVVVVFLLLYSNKMPSPRRYRRWYNS
jgi:hypothetical protein